MTESNVRTCGEWTLQANGFCASNGLYMLFWMFLLGSIAGFFIEGLWSAVRWGKWAHHAGVVWGPLCTIYGLGAVVMYLAACLLPEQPLPRPQTVLAQFLVCAVAGTVVEYLVSLVQEHCFGSVSWDYSHHAFNIGGRVSLQMSFVWGAVGVVFLQLVFPWLHRLIAKVQGQSGLLVTWALIVFLCVDLAVSAAAVTRWRERGKGLAPQSSFGAAIDRHFDDERMETLFPNMQFTTTGSYSYESHAA